MRILNLSGSSLLAACGYNPESKVLAAQYHRSGDWYIYYGVSAEDFVAFITDEESQGKAFTKHIKKKDYLFRPGTPEEVERL